MFAHTVLNLLGHFSATIKTLRLTTCLPKRPFPEATLQHKELSEIGSVFTFSFAKHFTKAELNHSYRQWRMTPHHRRAQPHGALPSFPGAPQRRGSSPPFRMQWQGFDGVPGPWAPPALRFRFVASWKKLAVPAAVLYQVTKTEVLGHRLFQKKNKSPHFNGTNFACETCIHTVLTV